MTTAFWIILSDLILLGFYILQYRQELGLTVNGSHDEPVRRKQPARNPPQPPSPPPSPSPAPRAAGAIRLGSIRDRR